MVSYISASYVYPVTGDPIKNGVIGVDDKGMITAVLTPEEVKKQQISGVTQYEGLLVPGFVNTHCHLELSHLKWSIEQHTGLPRFVQEIIRLRSASDNDLHLAMLKAEAEMFENGIVAVGDISNQAISAVIKGTSPIHYHTFLEIMGFNPDGAQQAMSRALEFKKKFDDLPVSIVPHATYSVSEPLFRELKENAEKCDGLVSIHNQETADENAFFENKSGAFLDLYKFLGVDIAFYKPSGKTSLQTILPLLSAKQKTLLVHNTFTTKRDVEFASALHPNLYWCLCPNANLYIENRLPDVMMLRAAGLKITLGTDSLASNSALSVLAEMKTLQEHFSIPVDELIKWGTLNGAGFLGIDDRFGSLEVGKRPGINLLEYTESDGEVMLTYNLKRLF